MKPQTKAERAAEGKPDKWPCGFCNGFGFFQYHAGIDRSGENEDRPLHTTRMKCAICNGTGVEPNGR